MIPSPKPLLDPNARWFDPTTGKPTREFYLYLKSIDTAVRALAPLVNDLEIRVTELELP